MVGEIIQTGSVCIEILLTIQLNCRLRTGLCIILVNLSGSVVYGQCVGADNAKGWLIEDWDS